MYIVGAHLGDGSIKMIAQAHNDRFDDFAFAFQRAAVMYPIYDPTNADDHGFSASPFLTPSRPDPLRYSPIAGWRH
jgi:hypothetical protein